MQYHYGADADRRFGYCVQELRVVGRVDVWWFSSLAHRVVGALTKADSAPFFLEEGKCNEFESVSFSLIFSTPYRLAQSYE